MHVDKIFQVQYSYRHLSKFKFKFKNLFSGNMKIVFYIVSCIVLCVNGFPQSSLELAEGTKYIEQVYYNKDVKYFVSNHRVKVIVIKKFQAPNLIPFDNPTHIDNAKEETEGYGSKFDSIYDGAHKKTANIFNVT